MDQHEKMHARAYRHWKSTGDGTPAGQVGALALARAIGRSQKGRLTLLDGWCLPRPWALLDEFIDREAPLGLKAGAAEAAGLSERELEALRELARSFQAERAWRVPMHPAFGRELGAFDHVSLHDERLSGWIRIGDEVRLDFTGFHAGPDRRVDGLALIFKGARTKALWRGRQAVLAQEGAWRRVGGSPGRVEGKGWFARPRRGLANQGARLAFPDVAYVDTGQFSGPREGRPEIRLAFGHSKEFELAVSGESALAVVGADAIRAFDESRELTREVLEAGGAASRARRSL